MARYLSITSSLILATLGVAGFIFVLKSGSLLGLVSPPSLAALWWLAFVWLFLQTESGFWLSALALVGSAAGIAGLILLVGLNLVGLLPVAVVSVLVLGCFELTAKPLHWRWGTIPALVTIGVSLIQPNNIKLVLLLVALAVFVSALGRLNIESFSRCGALPAVVVSIVIVIIISFLTT